MKINEKNIKINKNSNINDRHISRDFSEIFDETENFKDIGTLFIDARVKKALTQEDVSKILKVRISAIKQIEKGEELKLLGSAYRLGFLRSYAKLVGLEPNDIIKNYVSLHDQKNIRYDYNFPGVIKEKKSLIPIIALFTFLFSLVIYSSWYYLNINDLNIDNQNTTLLNNDIDNRYLDYVKVENKPIKLSENTDKKNNENIALTKKKISEIIINENPNDNDKSKNRLSSKVSDETLSGNETSAIANERIPKEEMVLKSSGNSWVEIEDLDGNSYLTRLMRSGETFVVPNKKGLTLSTGNAGVLSLTFGSIHISKLGGVGEVISSRPLNIEAFKKGNISIRMDFNSLTKITRKTTRKINIKDVEVGGDAPISVQTMTNTITSNPTSTLNQIETIEKAGADLVRVSCPDQDSTSSLKEIVKFSNIPIIADIHFHYLRAIEAAKAGASCLRINPGNIGSKEKVKDVINAAKDYDCAIRIGVNAGSLEKNILDKYKEPTYEALVESALFHASILQEQDFHRFKISVKASNALLSIAAYTSLSDKIDCPLHVGITEAGSFRAGTVKSSIGIGNLLLNGIGDTIRVSLSSDPCDEVKVGFDILKSLGLRQKGVTVISCPSCARQQFDVISTVREIEEQLDDILTPITVSIIGCVVNGPGEARSTDVGITGGGKGTHQIYVNGIPDHVIKNQSVVDHVVNEVRKKLSSLN